MNRLRDRAIESGLRNDVAETLLGHRYLVGPLRRIMRGEQSGDIELHKVRIHVIRPVRPRKLKLLFNNVSMESKCKAQALGLQRQQAPGARGKRLLAFTTSFLCECFFARVTGDLQAHC